MVPDAGAGQTLPALRSVRVGPPLVTMSSSQLQESSSDPALSSPGPRHPTDPLTLPSPPPHLALPAITHPILPPSKGITSPVAFGPWSGWRADDVQSRDLRLQWRISRPQPTQGLSDVLRLRGLLDRYSIARQRNTTESWEAYIEIFQLYSNGPLFEGRSPRWWQGWISTPECSLLKECMAEMIISCPAATRDARDDDYRQAICKALGAAMQLARLAGVLDWTEPQGHAREASFHAQPWLMEWFLAPGRQDDIVAAAIAVACMPSIQMRGPPRPVEWIPVSHAMSLVVTSALSPLRRPESEVLSVNRLMEVLGASLRVSIPLARACLEQLRERASTSGVRASNDLLVRRTGHRETDGLIAQLAAAQDSFFVSVLIGISQTLRWAGTILALGGSSPVAVPAGCAAAVAIASADQSDRGDGGAWRKGHWRAIVPSVLHAHQLLLDILGATPSEGVARECKDALNSCIRLLVKQVCVSTRSREVGKICL